MADFWWKNKREGRGLHWKSWDQLTRSKNTGGLGFKDLEAFNFALFGKQLWRMMTHKESLLARLFKSRYFAKSDPLSATLGSRPSYAWRSIHAAQQLIKQGARVTIGDGRDTNLWQEPWISTKPARAVTSMRRITSSRRENFSSTMKVQELLIENTREWDMQKLQELFTLEESRLIQEVRVMGNNTEDTYCWDYTKTGQYTIKSGYWVQQNVIKANQSEVLVDQPSFDYLYQLIWQVKTSPKVQHFLWKCLSNTLPVAENMKRRHIAREDDCSRCSLGPESINHALFQCPLARLVWASSNFPAPPEGVMANSIYSNIHHVLTVQQKYPKNEINGELAPWIIWRLWKNRNELIYRGKAYGAHSIIQKATEDALEWKSGNEDEKREVKATVTTPAPTRWKSPPSNWVKCNTDGAWNQETGYGGTGWICRDHNGNMLWAGARACHNFGAAIEAEAEAIRWAIETMSTFQYRQVYVESDSQVLVRMIRGEEEIWPKLKPIIQEIQNRLKQRPKFEVVYQQRGGNMAADRIAKETFSFKNNVPRLYSIVPSWLMSYVEVDKPYVR